MSKGTDAELAAIIARHFDDMDHWMPCAEAIIAAGWVHPPTITRRRLREQASRINDAMER